MLTLTPDQIEEITGYRQPAAQLAALHRRGYWRAYRDRLGRVVLERAHYDAVAAGAAAAEQHAPQPRLRPPKLRTA